MLQTYELLKNAVAAAEGIVRRQKMLVGSYADDLSMLKAQSAEAVALASLVLALNKRLSPSGK